MGPALLFFQDGDIVALGEKGGLDEERRLLYVALTRARRALVVSAPLRYYHRRRGADDAHSYGQLSRFLTGDVVATFDTVAVGTGAAELPSDGNGSVPVPGDDPVAAALDAPQEAWRAGFRRLVPAKNL